MKPDIKATINSFRPQFAAYLVMTLRGDPEAKPPVRITHVGVYSEPYPTGLLGEFQLTVAHTPRAYHSYTEALRALLNIVWKDRSLRWAHPIVDKALE